MLLARIAIISDLHCQSAPKKPKKGKPSSEKPESYLSVGGLRVPEDRHPIQSLLKLAENENIQSDILMCPGDISNKISQEGLSHCWPMLIEVQRKLGSSDLICTIGNHDIDSRKKHYPDPFKIPKEVYPNFPFFRREDADLYWSKGYIFRELTSNLLVLDINSAADHFDEPSAMRGTLSVARLAQLRNDLEAYDGRTDIKAKIGLLHHHPTLHSGFTDSALDVLENGEELLEILSSKGFSLIVHGHRHYPKIKRYIHAGNSMIILASGSFSAVLDEATCSNTRNLFHVISIDLEGTEFTYTLKSWEFNWGYGWNPATKKSAGIPHEVRFKNSFLPIDPIDIDTFVEARGGAKVDGSALYSNFPQLEYYLPEEMEALIRRLRDAFSIEAHCEELTRRIYEMGKIRGAGL